MHILKTFWLLFYTSMAYFAKFHASRWLLSKFMAILGWSVARRIKFFLSKSLKTEYAIKSRDLLCFYSNFNTTLILIVEICWKSQILKNFQIWTPHKENPQIFLDFLDFWPKISQSGLTNIFSHLKLLVFQDIYMWHILAKFHGRR